MKTRIISSSLVIAFILVALLTRLFTPYIYDAIVLFVGVIGCIEIARAYSNNRKIVNEAVSTSMMFTLYLGIFYAINNGMNIMQILGYFGILILVYFLFTFLVTFFYKEKTLNEILKVAYTKTVFKYSLEKSFRTISVLIYPGIFFAFLILLNHIDAFYILQLTEDAKIKTISIFVNFVIISTFVGATFTDTAALFVGTAIKGPKLCPRISPKKTISGAIGGWLFGFIGILGTYMLFSKNSEFMTIINNFEISWTPVVVYAIIAPVVNQIGDLIASFIKRKTNIKDYGDLIPGHGGVMDRIDGLIFVAGVSLIFSVLTIL